MNLFLEKILNRVRAKSIGLQLSKFRKNNHYFVGKVGLEIGGPSAVFGSGQILPVYPLAERVDGVNFSTQTVWENSIQAGKTYEYENGKVGFQYILEASNLSGIADEQYDFILSSHSLEHCANPLKALKEWQRVLRKGGVILVAVPDRRVTFDWRRNVTNFDHLLRDYEANIGEDDQAHFKEIMDLHDLSKDPGVESHEEFMQRSLKNYENRCLHHHVFDINLLQQASNYLGLKIIFTDSYLPSLIILGEK